MTGESEINYRVRLRTSQILSVLGMDKKKVFDNLGIAYQARSKFAHGDKLSPKAYKKILERYKHAEILELTILDYVRILVVSILIIDYDKNALLKLVDESWLECKKLKKLEKILAKPKKLLALSDYCPKYIHMHFHYDWDRVI